MIRFRAPAALKERLEKIAAESTAGEDSSELMRRALVLFLEEAEKKERKKK